MTVTATPHGYVVNVTSSSGAESVGELLWVWYLVFTVVLLALIVASFIRFHYKRGLQQKVRLDTELSYAVKRRHMTSPPSPQSFSNHVAMTPAALVNLDTQRLLTSHHHNDVRGHQRSRDGDARRAPVVYMFNANGSMVDVTGHVSSGRREVGGHLEVKGRETSGNGSMVDVRCEQLEICNTFRLDNGYNTDDQQHIHLHSVDPDLDLDDLQDIDASRRRKSCLKSTYDPLTSRSASQTVDGDLPQANHHSQSSQLHLLHHHHHQQQQQQQHHRRLSPSHHRYRHRHMTSSSTRTSLLHPTRLGREYLASSDEELSRSAAAAEALMLWQKR